MHTTDPLRAHLRTALEWDQARVPLTRAFESIPPDVRGSIPEGLPYSLWQLLEHIRIAQRDLVEFCTVAAYGHPDWPDDYWPTSPDPPSNEAWDQSLAACLADRRRLQAIVLDPDVDLFGVVPAGRPGQTYLRGVLLAIDHAAYHVGQVVVARRLLGTWPP